MEQILSWSRILISLAFLAYASWSDFKTREVSNSVWMLYAPAAFILALTQILFFGLNQPFSFGISEPFDSLLFYGLCFAIVSVFSIALFYAGAFGGADAKALMCLALSLPWLPNTTEPRLSLVSPIFPITVFSNTVLLAALTVVYAVARNSLWRLKTGRKLFEGFEGESIWRKFLAFLTGYKVKTAELAGGHLLPLEDIAVSETRMDERRLLVLPRDEKREAIVGRILSATQEGRLQNEVWATPGLPLLVFMTLGLVVALTFGDLAWILLRLILP